jgi:hypothetical protein
VEGEQILSFLIGNATYLHTFIICQLPTNASGTIGLDFLKPREAILNLDNSTLVLNKKRQESQVQMIGQESSDGQVRKERNGLITHGTLFPFPQRKNLVAPVRDCKIQEDNSEGQKAKEEENSSRESQPISIVESNAWLVQCKESVLIQPKTKQVLYGKLIREKPPVLPNLFVWNQLRYT